MFIIAALLLFAVVLGAVAFVQIFGAVAGAGVGVGLLLAGMLTLFIHHIRNT